MKRIFTLFAMALLCLSGILAQRYAGGDISLLPDYEKAGAKYNDYTGKLIPELLPWLHQEGMNAMRVRLFVNPKKYKELHSADAGDTKYDPNACQDLGYIKPLCKRIVDNGMDLMLDFHYSDTWADPAKQWTPIDWQTLNDEQLYQKIYDYTKETLEALKADGIVPAFIQPGNEISYGMLWGPAGTSSPKKALMGSDANWARFGKLLNNAIKACREVCPKAKIVIHTERVEQTGVQKNFYDQMKKLGIDYDIIGLSYYPYWHGDISVLANALTSLEQNYPEKKIMIVEMGYSYKWALGDKDFSSKWPLSYEGQAKYAKDLVTLLEQHPAVNGLFWWWMEYNAYGTSLQGWYNAPLFDSTNGRATPALKEICSFAESSGVEDITTPEAEEQNRVWYDLSGRRVDNPVNPGIYVSRGRKIIVR